MWNYKNPVEIIAGPNSLDSLTTLVGSQAYGVVTYDTEFFAHITAQIGQRLGRAPSLVIDQVEPNPSLANLEMLCGQLAAAQPKPQILIALGGGSAMDVCKVLSACEGDYQRFEAILHHRETLHQGLPYVAIPTTAGTGSEVTCWATVWDPINVKKYSLSNPALYAKAAILSAELTVELPRDLTISTALDALSHALESLWNINRNPISAHYAVAAAKLILKTLPLLMDNERDLKLRYSLQLASLMAGMAFSNTKTSIAHNISYALTLDKGVSHGVACSFTLPMLVRAIDDTDLELLAYIQQIFAADKYRAAEQLEAFFTQLQVSLRPQDYGYEPAQWLSLLQEAGQGARGKNYTGDIDRLALLYQQEF